MRKCLVLAALVSAVFMGCSTSNTGTGGTSSQGMHMESGAQESRTGDVGNTIGNNPSSPANTNIINEPVAPTTGANDGK